VVCNEQQARELAPTLAAVGFEVADPEASASRARDLDAPSVFRRTRADEQELPAFRSPDGTEVFLAGIAEDDATWVSEFEGGSAPAQELLLTGIDAVRLALNVAPLAFTDPYGFPQHVAFTSSDVMATARAARARGLRPLPIPLSYYDDLVARFDLPPGRVEEMMRLGVLYDRDDSGDFTHFYTETIGSVFFEVVQRRGSYDGYGAANAPVRLAAQYLRPAHR
jgi:4-hydroxyphenylpyruvate dioxygenase